MNLSKVSIGIKTFLRDPQLFNTIAAIRRTMPECRLIIADCGEHTHKKYELFSELTTSGVGHLCFTLPFDAGFGVMSNLIASAVTTPYLLIGSDDFDFNPPEVRQGIEKLLWAIETPQHQDLPLFDIVSGRVNNNHYEFFLIDKGEEVEEKKCRFDEIKPVLPVVQCDLTVNYSLFRREVFQKCRWLDSVKIGGAEHGAMFIKYKRAGFRVGFVPGVNINELTIESTERYRQFRNRAKDPSRPCFDEIGVRKYVLGSGQIDYEKHG